MLTVVDCCCCYVLQHSASFGIICLFLATDIVIKGDLGMCLAAYLVKVCCECLQTVLASASTSDVFLTNSNEMTCCLRGCLFAAHADELLTYAPFRFGRSVAAKPLSATQYVVQGIARRNRGALACNIGSCRN